jgi:hypothetical protein
MMATTKQQAMMLTCYFAVAIIFTSTQTDLLLVAKPSLFLG